MTQERQAFYVILSMQTHRPFSMTTESSRPTESKSVARPPGKRITWLLIGSVLIAGVACGMGAFTFGYGQGASYFGNQPQSCANCHIMQDHYQAWQKSSHHHVAVCNDCHLPDHPLGKWVTKMDNGFFHSLAFTLDDFPEPLQIKERNLRIAEDACRRCHQDFTHEISRHDQWDDLISCMHCHQGVGHSLR